jgi:hypothetical protein
MNAYHFTTNWFSLTAQENWERLLPAMKPARILMGSFEGASTCFLIDALAAERPIELHCVDTWGGGIEHQAGRDAAAEMSAVEKRFLNNTQVAMTNAKHAVDLVVHKSYSHLALSSLLAEGKQAYFDFIYVDGSHQAPDVLCDAVLAFKLLRVGGTLGFDDYLWAEELPTGKDPLQCPKPAIDAFVNIN